MPYTESNLPSNVKKLPAKKRRQWVHVWNSTYERTKDESRAFASANSVVSKGKKEESILDAQKGYLYDTYEVESRRIPKDAAGYDPYGAKGGKGCASCHWFVSPSSCVLVSGDISPTGMSNLYASATEMRNTIMEAYNSAENKPSVLSKIVNAVKNVIKPGEKSSTNALSPFVLFRDNKDNLRFMAVYSNIFEDKHNQILTTESHKEYTDWVSESKIYPDLHIWHCGGGSKIGSCDLIDFVDGFSVASGTIDSDKEDIAYKAAESDPGVSHGFVGLLQLDTGLWNRYRTFEVSVLPAWAAGNENLDVLYTPGSKELFMPFDPKKREYLTGLGIDDDTINSWESAAKEQADNLKAMNIAHKALETDAPEKPKEGEDQSGRSDINNTPNSGDTGAKSDAEAHPSGGKPRIIEPTNEPANASLATKSELAFFVKSFTEQNTALAEMAKSMASLANTVKSIQDEINTLKKSPDQRAADEWHARAAATPGGYIASQQKSNQTNKEENQAADDFFGTIVMDQVNKALGIGGS